MLNNLKEKAFLAIKSSDCSCSTKSFIRKVSIFLLSVHNLPQKQNSKNVKACYYPLYRQSTFSKKCLTKINLEPFNSHYLLIGPSGLQFKFSILVDYTEALGQLGQFYKFYIYRLFVNPIYNSGLQLVKKLIL